MKNFRILLINPTSPEGTLVSRDSMGGFGVLCGDDGSGTTYPPMSLLYCGAVLETENEEVKIIDCVQPQSNRIEFNYIIKKIENFDTIGILIALPSYFHDLEFAREIKDRFPSKNTVILGPVISYCKKDAMKRSKADFGIIGEPEYVFSKLVRAMKNGSEYGNIYGLIRKERDNIIFTNENSNIETLDALPFPAWHLLLNQQKIQFAIQSSRGCPYECCYCPYHIVQGSKFRFRTPENVVSEFMYLKKQFNIKYIRMRDPCFTLRKDRVKDICLLLRTKNIKIKFGIETRSDNVDNKLLVDLKEVGCDQICVGVESGDPEVLVRSNRFKSASEAHKSLIRLLDLRKTARKLNISINAFFILGLPGDNRRSIKKTMDYVQKLKAENVQFSFITPFPGTKLFNERKKFFRIPDDFIKMNSFMTSCIGTDELSPGNLENLMQEILFKLAIRNIFRKPRTIFFQFLKSKKKGKYIIKFFTYITRLWKIEK